MDRVDEKSIGSTERVATAPSGLEAEQIVAMERLVSGVSLADAADAAGVHRTTVYRWLKDDPAFQAVYNEWHDEMQASCRSRLMMLTDKATAAMERALELGDSKMALALLKGMGMISRPGVKLTHARDIERKSMIQKLRRQAQLDRAEAEAAREAIKRKEVRERFKIGE